MKKCGFTPDIIITWPRNCDYPIWRKFIKNNRFRFNDIIVVIMETNGGWDYRPFVYKTLGEMNCKVVESPRVIKDDWRNVAVNYGLSLSKSEWVWFTEQDFLPIKKFWDWVYACRHDRFNTFGAWVYTRLHPCCIFSKREIIEKTNKNFSATDKVDHFGLFQADLEKLNIPIGMIFDGMYHHMNGLSHNFYLMSNNQPVNYMPDEYNEYIRKCLTMRDLDEHFKQLCKDYVQSIR